MFQRVRNTGRTEPATPTAASDGLARLDPLYAQAVCALQQGEWEETERLLATLESSYGASPDLRRMRQSLALHLSAERSSPVRQRAFPEVLQSPVIRLLLAVNVGLYLVLGALWLLTRSTSCAHR